MKSGRVLSVDIGSTYTKGALFEFEGPGLKVLKRASRPTTQDDLARGFGLVAAELLGVPWKGSLGDLDRGVPIRFSSSAKGGLRVGAIGLVPDLTLQVARLAAWSAGARIVGTSSYRLTEEILAGLLRSDPDIILLSGGTDGGNEKYVLANAALLAASSFAGTVIYAGNRATAGDAARLLSGKTFVLAENVLPEIGTLKIEPAREAIRKIFLDTIIRGKGLEVVRLFCGADPKPTPLGVFDLVKAIGERAPDWKDFCVIDLGGATTDFYSAGEAYRAEDGVVLRGLKEPYLKRTVEGDLGLRVSAEALFLTARAWLEEAAGPREFPGLEAWVERLKANPETLPANETEERYDALLAAACSYFSAFRHAGFFQESWTPAGKIFLQSGKDLRPYGRLVGTGGYLSRTARPFPLFDAFAASPLPADAEGRLPLLPRKFRYFRDSSYLFPLLGNLAEDWPEAAVSAALEGLDETETRMERT